MDKRLIAITVILFIAIITLIVYLVYTVYADKNQISSDNAKIQDLSTQLVSTQAQLISASNQLSSTRTQLNSTNTQLNTANGQLKTVNGQLTTCNDNKFLDSSKYPGIKWKGGLNGTTNCSTYCLGSGWGGWSGDCDFGVDTNGVRFYNCSDVVGWNPVNNINANVSCACSSPLDLQGQWNYKSVKGEQLRVVTIEKRQLVNASAFASTTDGKMNYLSNGVVYFENSKLYGQVTSSGKQISMNDGTVYLKI